MVMQSRNEVPILPPVWNGSPFYGVWLRSASARAAVFLLALVTLAALSARVIRQTMAARYALDPTVDHLQRAIALEPDMAEYRNQLGEIYLYSFSSYDPPLAVESLKKAVQLNPHVAVYWLNLARALDSSGQKQEALQAVKTARRYDPRNPSLAWAVGNAYAVDGSVRPALEAWREAIQGDPGNYTSLAMEVSWKLAPDTRTQLEHLLPDDNQADFRFLQFLLLRHAGEPALVWRRIVERGRAFDPVLARSYLDSLIYSRKDYAGRRADSAAALREWKELLRVAAPSRGEETGNLINNPGFEDEILSLGFDWRWIGAPGADMVLDNVVTHGGRRSVRIDFDGSQNLYFKPFYQIVRVEPNRHYLLSAFLRAQQISSSSGPRLQVADRFNPGSNNLDILGREVFETNGWVEERLEFTSPSACYQVMIGLARKQSDRFSPQIRGSFWLDDVKLVEIGQ